MLLQRLCIGLVACVLLAGVVEAEFIIMGEGSDGSATNNSYSKGNTVSVDTAMTLDTIGIYLTGVAAGTNIEWAAYEGDTLTGTFNQVYASSGSVAGGDGYFDSGPVGITLQPGKFYWLGGFWDQPVTYWYSNTMPGAPQTFPTAYGTMTYHSRKGAYGTFPGPLTFSGSGSTNAPYWQHYNVIPEPASVLGLGASLALLAIRRR